MSLNYRDLLEYPLVLVDSNIKVLSGFYHNHLEVIRADNNMNLKHVKIHYLVNHYFDERRVWRLFYVSYFDKPFMLCKEYGREGDDYHNKVIFDLNLFSLFVQDIFNTIEYNCCYEKKEDWLEIDTLIQKMNWLSLDCNADDFVSFEGYSLNDIFAPC